MDESRQQAMDEFRKPVCIPTKDGFSFIAQHEIIYIEARHNFSCIFLTGKPTGELVPLNIEKIEKVFRAAEICRIHRSYIVYIHAIKFMNTRKTRVFVAGNTYLPVGRIYLPALLNKLLVIKP